MPDIPAWWAQQSSEAKAVAIICGIIAFFLALALLPPILILAGLGMVAYGTIAHIYQATVKGKPWTQFEGMHVFSCITGVVVLFTGVLLTWIF